MLQRRFRDGIISICKSPKLELRETKKYGLGVFADENIREGQTIHLLTGEAISLAECIRRVKDGEETVDDPLQIEIELYLDLDYLSRAFNHSCDPSAGLRNRSELFALRNIRKGEEITYDYSATVGPNISAAMWQMPCCCSATSCRKQIGNILTLPPETLTRYQKLGALQDYIMLLLEKLENNGSRTVKK